MCEQSATSECERTFARAGGCRAGTVAAGLAFAISAVTSPFVVLPGFASLLTWRYSPDWRHFLVWSGIAIFFTTGIPFLYIALATRTGRITDIHVMRRDQRSGPFLLSLVSSSTGSALLHHVGAPLPLVCLGVAIVANGIVFALITLRWKISMHLSVYTASTVAAAVLIDGRSLWLLALLPAVIWARTRRTRHSVSQGVAAVLVSAAVTVGVLALFGYLEVG